jgi:peptide/nickel transport system substrate-binding protein
MTAGGSTKSALTIAAAGLLAFSLAACGNSTPSGSGGSSTAGGEKLADGKTFTLVLGADPGNLDPHFTSLSVTLQVDRFLYDTLATISGDKMLPNLAASWTDSPTKAVFTLRKDITCSDGTKLTASDVADNINFVGDPKNKSTRIGVFVPPGATAVGDDAAGTVTVTAATPDPFLARTVAGLQIVCPKGMKDRGILKSGGDGTGMFTLTDAVAGDHYTFTRRKDYAWGTGDWKTDQKGLPDKVVLKVVSNESTAANLFLSGQVNAVNLIGPDKQRVAAKKPFERDLESPLGELWFNHKPGMPTADASVRKALTQALDLSQLEKVVTSGTGKPATGLVAPSLGPCGGDTVSGNLPAHDADAAKAALAGKKLKIAFYYPTSLGPTFQSAAELVQQVWGKLGVDVQLKGISDAEAASLVLGGQGPWNAAFLPIGVDLPTQLVPFLSGATPPNGSNFAYIQNPQYTAAVQQAAAKAGTAGCAEWGAAEKALFAQVDLVPFANSVSPTFGQHATFELMQGSILPSSIRMLA